MKDQSDSVFVRLFKSAAEKCFGHALIEPLSEVDSRHFSTSILEKTGLVIGPKSLRNYSLYVLGAAEGRKENPSVATLDTLARYLANAPKTDEAQRKEKEAHFPYWFQFKATGSTASAENVAEKSIQRSTSRKTAVISGSVLLGVVLLLLIGSRFQTNTSESFSDDFKTSDFDSLSASGWKTNPGYKVETVNSLPGHLQLLTMPGDNWGGENEKIKHILWRELLSECFTTEIHLADFFPQENWQQAGLLLSEDDSFSGKTIRLAISYNDFFGGYRKDPEIIIQAMSSTESGDRSKPEEIAHLSVLSIEPGNKEIVQQNLKRVALKLERTGKKIRLLYFVGQTEGFAFKEVVTGDFNFTPKYIGIYASQGVSSNTVIPVFIDSFSISEVDCGNLD